MIMPNQQRKDVQCSINNVNFRAGSTIFVDEPYFLQNAIWIKQDAFTLCLTLAREEANTLINLLNQHLDNIKANEIELLALNAKAAA